MVFRHRVGGPHLDLLLLAIPGLPVAYQDSLFCTATITGCKVTAAKLTIVCPSLNVSRLGANDVPGWHVTCYDEYAFLRVIVRRISLADAKFFRRFPNDLREMSRGLW